MNLKRKSVLFVGCGQIGTGLTAILSVERFDFYGLCRAPHKLPHCIRGFQGDYATPGGLDVLKGLRPDMIVVMFKPQSQSVEGYESGFAHAAKRLVKVLDGYTPEATIMVSSTRVFGEADGGWVDEFSPLSTNDPRALAIIEAEQRLLEIGNTTVVRFGGLYGNPDSVRLDRIASGSIAPSWPIRYSNRLHRADSLGFLAHLMEQSADGVTLEPCYIGVDNEPAPMHVVEEWLAEEMGVAYSETAPINHAVSHRRCNNELLKRSGYQLMYPHYRAGYSAVLAARGERRAALDAALSAPRDSRR